MRLTTHRNTVPHCGAAGPIALVDGIAWSVNAYGGGVVDWRFKLTDLPTGCPVCEHLNNVAIVEHRLGNG